MLNRRLNLALAFSSALLLAGCASSPERSEFVEIENNAYTISASSNSTDNGGIVRVELIKQAQKFCADKDLKFRLLKSRFNDGNDDKSATATIDFVCESPTAASATSTCGRSPLRQGSFCLSAFRSTALIKAFRSTAIDTTRTLPVVVL